jgi:hypothetical protein
MQVFLNGIRVQSASGISICVALASWLVLAERCTPGKRVHFTLFEAVPAVVVSRDTAEWSAGIGRLSRAGLGRLSRSGLGRPFMARLVVVLFVVGKGRCKGTAIAQC